ncbi:hypothetical protein [Bradyrhizobium sp. STM 3562]|uniref:hypothetical protein n=1 Tax=Bradyrhizobium sp. STM 3562 TaxID=578924 RepID=UPI00388EF436
MFERVTKFRMLGSRRLALDVLVPANDNRRGTRQSTARRARAPRLICRWALGEGTNRPTCRWELESADEPNPSLQFAAAGESGIHKTVLRLSYLRLPLGAALRYRDTALDTGEPSYGSRARPDHRVVLHVRH